MKKIILLTALLCLLSSVSFAHVRSAAEPEWDGYYSFTNQSVTTPFWGGARLEYAFTKYTNGKNTEYWFRLNKNKDEDKLLPYATFIIDGVAYPITAVKNPDAKYTEAGLSLIDVAVGANVMQQGINRYFPLSNDLIAKIKTAQEIQIKFDTVDRINRTATIQDDLIEAMQNTIDMSYDDIKAKWTPKDDEEKTVKEAPKPSLSERIKEISK